MREPKEVILPNGKTLENELCEDRPNLYGADLSCVNLHEADLYGVDLSCVNLCGANLIGADLRRADLHEADLSGANLHGADLRWAKLHEADLHEADLSGADLRGADLHGANLIGANLRWADLRGADLREAKNIISIGPIGSRGDMLYAVRWKAGAMVKTGCFWGTLEEFESAVLKTHGKDSRVSDEYRRAIDLISTWCK